jgi:hypothetical protein
VTGTLIGYTRCSTDQRPHHQLASRLRARINVACRIAAGERRTCYEATDHRITIGIAGPDARERITGLRREIQRIGRNRGWTIIEDLHQEAQPGPRPLACDAGFLHQMRVATSCCLGYRRATPPHSQLLMRRAEVAQLRGGSLAGRGGAGE